MARTILVVDDSADLRMLMKMYLEIEGFEVQTATDGVDALSQLNKGLSPCLILLDMVMDGMGGEEFLQALETEHPKVFAAIPVIATSALESVPLGK